VHAAASAANSDEQQGARALLDVRLWIYAAIVLAITGAWYWWAAQLRLETGLSFGIWNSDKFANWSLAFSRGYWYELVVERLAERHATWPGAACVLVGLCLRRRDSRERLFDVWLLSLLVYSLIVARGNSLHEYYQLPWTLPLAFWMARGVAGALSRGKRVMPLAAISAVVVLSLGRLLEYRGACERQASSLLAVAAEIRRQGVPPLLDRPAAGAHDLGPSRVVIVSSTQVGDPSLLYHANVKGWVTSLDALTPEVVADLRSRGARVFAGTSDSFGPPPAGQWRADLRSQWPRWLGGEPRAAAASTQVPMKAVEALGEVRWSGPEGFVASFAQ
jgi:hypothetical protein